MMSKPRKRQEQQIAEINRFLNQLQDGKEVDSAGNPDKQIIASLVALSAQSEPREEFVAALSERLKSTNVKATETAGSTVWQRTRTRLSAVAAVFILCLLIILTVPQVRTLAQDIINDLFNRAPADVMVERGVHPSPTRRHIRYLEFGTVAEAEAELGIDLPEPTVIPDGYKISKVHITDDGQTIGIGIELIGLRGGRQLYINRRQPPTSERDGLVGASAEIVPVEIQGREGEYVEGVWKSVSPTESEWINDSVFRRLRWQDGDYFYEIIAAGGSPGSRGYLDQEDLIEFAEGFR